MHLPTFKNLLFGLGVVAVCCAFVWGGMAVRSTNKPVLAKTPAHSFVWSDRVPLSKAMLASWLSRRGAAYRAWSKQHPVAARKLLKHNEPNPAP